MTTDIKAAAERLRRVKAGESLAAVYADKRYPSATNYQLAYECDIGTLADFALGLLDETPRTMRQIEEAAIDAALARNNGDKPAAAKELDVSLKTIYNHLNGRGPTP